MYYLVSVSTQGNQELSDRRPFSQPTITTPRPQSRETGHEWDVRAPSESQGRGFRLLYTTDQAGARGLRR